ncbi:MAG: hypothetical protein ACTS45_00410 [Candidatus Hodgkinia cicadicola]
MFCLNLKLKWWLNFWIELSTNSIISNGKLEIISINGACLTEVTIRSNGGWESIVMNVLSKLSAVTTFEYFGITTF